MGTRVTEHATNIPFEAFRSAQLASRSTLKELGIRHGVPKEVREPACQLVGSPRTFRAPFCAKKEAGRLKHGFDNQLGSFQAVPGPPLFSREQI